MHIEFSWWQLLLIGIVLMTIVWGLIMLLRRKPANSHVVTAGRKALYALCMGVVTGALLAYALGALLPTHVILMPKQEHHTRYVLDSSTIASDMLGIYIDNRSGETFIVDYAEYDNEDYGEAESTEVDVADGEKVPLKRVPNYYYEYPPNSVRFFKLDFGKNRKYFVVEKEAYFDYN